MKKVKQGKHHFFIPPIEAPILEREKIEIVRVGEERQIVINGVKRIIQYDRSCMIFLLAKENVEIHGDSLDCISYISGAIGIGGKIEKICFARKEKA